MSATPRPPANSYDSRLGEIRWERLGDPDAEPVVMLHGTPFSSYIWRDIAAAVAGHRCVYTFDLPGYGTSAMSEGQDLSLDALAEVFVDLVDHWGLTRPDVVAHDSGGAVALGAHVDRGLAYRSLALVDAVSLAPWGSEFFAQLGPHTDALRHLPAQAHRLLLREYVTTASSPGLRPSVLDALTAPWLGDAGQAAFFRQLVQRRADPVYIERIQDRYAAIDLPVLLCWGADDTWVPADRGRELATRIDGADLHIIDGAGPPPRRLSRPADRRPAHVPPARHTSLTGAATTRDRRCPARHGPAQAARATDSAPTFGHYVDDEEHGQGGVNAGGEPVEDHADPGAEQDAVPDRTGGVPDGEVGEQPERLQHHAEHEQLEHRVRRGVAEELGQERGEEEHDLRVGQVHQETAPERPRGPDGGCGQRRAAATPRRPRQIREVGRAAQPDQIGRARCGRKERTQPQRGEDDVDAHTRRDAERRVSRRSPSAAQAGGDHEGHVRTRRQQDHHDGDEERREHADIDQGVTS